MATPLPPDTPRRRPAKRHLGLWIAAAFIGLVLAGALWFAMTPKPSPNANVATATVTEGLIQKTVSATGKVVSNFEVEIKAKASGKIIRLPYDVSDYVSKGALLVELDPIDENRDVSQTAATLSGLQSKVSQSQVNLQVAKQTLSTDLSKAHADLAAALAKYNDARAKSNRLEMLAQQRYISQEEAETGRTTEAQARTDLKDAQTHLRELQTQHLSLQSQVADVHYSAAQARAQQVALAEARQRLFETKIYAPISGVVTTRTGQIGTIVASGISNVSGGTSIMTLADLSHIYVLATVDESDIGQVREGQTVNITADAFPGEVFKGRVTRIAPEGVEESNVVTFEVKIEINGQNSHLLKPTMTTNVDIVVAQNPHALKVPVEAVHDGKLGSFVLVKTANGPIQRQPVVTGLNNGTDIEIKSGLEPNEVVVTSQGQAKSHWRKDASSQNGQSGPNSARRGQMMMMRSLGGGRR